VHIHPLELGRASAATTQPAAEAALRRHRALAAKVENGAAVDVWQV